MPRKLMQWEPCYSDFIGEARYGAGWRVSLYGHRWIFQDRDCKFASKRDCELACKALNDAGITEEAVMEMTDEEFGKLVTSNLRW